MHDTMFTTINSMGLEPKTKEIPSKYEREINSYNCIETDLFRSDTSIEVLDKILPELSTRPNILLVGLGLSAHPLLCCYGPYRISGHLENKGFDYAMTLVDVDERIINDIKNRKKIFLSLNLERDYIRKIFEPTWKEYLSDTKQPGGTTSTMEDGLNFNIGSSEIFSENDYLKAGISFANIPSSFCSKMTNGEINLINDDIADVNLGDSKKFDFVECLNVLYLMSKKKQQLALTNISGVLKDSGRLLLNDLVTSKGNPLFENFGGWVNDEELKKLNLEKEDILYQNRETQKLLLRKIA
jgi:hypothetical protein